MPGCSGATPGWPSRSTRSAGWRSTRQTATLTSEYEGTVYYFCGKGCKLDFDDDPETYLDPSYTPEGM